VLVPSIGHRGIVLLCAALGGLSLTVLMLEPSDDQNAVFGNPTRSTGWSVSW
jgi:hypothetical protein